MARPWSIPTTDVIRSAGAPIETADADEVKSNRQCRTTAAAIEDEP